jgi:hypothetical protein
MIYHIELLLKQISKRYPQLKDITPPTKQMFLPLSNQRPKAVNEILETNK